MRRLLGIIGAVPLVLWAATGITQERMTTIGMLALGNPNPAVFIQETKAALGVLGYEEGKNVRYEIRLAEGRTERLDILARELVALKVNVLVAYQSPAVTAAKAATTELPIVMASVADPVRTGFVQTLARPGGNITGVTGSTSEMGVKNVELIRDVIPTAKRVALLVNELDPFHTVFVENLLGAAGQLKIETKVVLAKSGDDFSAHFEAMKIWGADAVIVQPTLPLARVADSASKSKLPVACPNLGYTAAGGLMAYGSDTSVMNKQGAVIIDKVLKGRKPADLPVEIATNFRLVLNSKVAAALGITFPPTLLSRADDVID